MQVDRIQNTLLLLIFVMLQISGTIEDPSVYLDIKKVLQKLGYAKNAPDPEIEK